MITEDGELWEAAADSTCSYKLWGDRLLKYGKRSIGPKEVKSMIEDGRIAVRLVARGSKNIYYKYIVPDIEYGFTIIWDEDI